MKQHPVRRERVSQRQIGRVRRLGAEDETIDAVFASLDADKSGFVRYEEMSAKLRRDLQSKLRHALVPLAQELSELWRKWDDDATGKIDVHEFRRAIYELGIVADKQTIEDAFASLDRNHSGTLEYDEVQTLLPESREDRPASATGTAARVMAAPSKGKLKRMKREQFVARVRERQGRTVHAPPGDVSLMSRPTLSATPEAHATAQQATTVAPSSCRDGDLLCA